MRLKTFSAPSMNEAMKLVKDHLGDDAIIVSTQKGDGGVGVRITAAMEEDAFDDFTDDAFEEGIAEEDIADALAQHGVPPELCDRLVRAATAMDTDDPLLALAGALDQVFTFQPLAPKTKKGAGRAVVLVGLPGAGKTVTAAKIATRAVLRETTVNVVTTDTVRAGGYDQLAAFTRLLKLDLKSAETPNALRKAMNGANGEDLTVVDCAGGNPFDEDDVRDQVALLRACDGAEVAFVIAAGGDPMESAEIAEAYAAMGARGLIATRIDIARRLGGVLAAADAGRLNLAEVGIGSDVAEGLAPLNPISLARLLLPHHASARDEAAD